MKKGIKYGVKIINDVSGLDYDSETINVLKKYKIPFFYSIHKEHLRICKINQSIKMNY
jgi:dihydropteroate synthase